MNYVWLFIVSLALALSSVGVDALMHPDCSYNSLSHDCH